MLQNARYGSTQCLECHRTARLRRYAWDRRDLDAFRFVPQQRLRNVSYYLYQNQAIEYDYNFLDLSPPYENTISFSNDSVDVPVLKRTSSQKRRFFPLYFVFLKESTINKNHHFSLTSLLLLIILLSFLIST